MSDSQHAFDQVMLSGFLDGELTQGDDQRVRLHLEHCAECRSVIEQLRKLREATMKTDFRVPEDTQWDETPRGAISRLFHNAGWLIAGLWVAGIAAYLVWQAATGTASFQLEALIGIALFLAFALIILSALVDRLKTRKSDPYRKVQK